MINLILNYISDPKHQTSNFWIAMGLTLSLAFGCFFLSVDFELEKLFPTNDPDLEFYEEIMDKKGYDNDFLLLTLYPGQNFFDSAFLNKSNLLIDSLLKLHSVKQVRSPLKLQYFDKSALGLTAYPTIHLEKPHLYTSDSLRITRSEFHSRFFYNFSFLPVYIKHRHFNADQNSLVFLDSVRNVINHFNIDFNLVGKLPAENAFKSEIKNDFGLYLGLSILLSLLVLFLIFRELKIVFIPFLISLLTLISTLGFIGLVGININIMGVLLPPILIFTSTSDAIHIINAYDPKKSHLGFEKVFLPTLLTSLTTAIGFLSLLWIDVLPVREFGISAAVGVLFAFILTYSVIPRLLSFRDRQVTYEADKADSRLFKIISKYPGQIITLALFVTILAISGIGKVNIDAYLLSDLPENHQITESFSEMDEQYGGSKPWMALVFTKGQSIWDSELDGELQALTQYLIEEYGVSGLQSPEYFDEYFESVYGKSDHPGARQRAKQLSDNLSDTSYLITGFIPEWGSQATRKKNDKLEDFVSKNMDQLQLRRTGTNYLIDKSHHQLSSSLLKGLITAILLVSLVLGLYFKSLKWMLISLLPNLLTLLMLGGIIGWLGIPLQLTNSIIFTIAFGIVVDDTIHFIVSYIEHKKTKNPAPLMSTFNVAGRSIIHTSIIILVGFSLFLLSDFGATYQLGLFLVIAISSALLLDLVLLPAILYKWDKPNDK